MQDHFLLRIMNLEQSLKSSWDDSYWIWGLLIIVCLMGHVLCVYCLAKPDSETPAASENAYPQPEETPQQNDPHQETEQLIVTHDEL